MDAATIRVFEIPRLTHDVLDEGIRVNIEDNYPYVKLWPVARIL